MSKYYSKLIQINENLDKELMEKGIVNSEINANDTIVKNNKTDMVKEEDENTIEIPKDSLTPDQKKEILLDKGVEQKTIDNLKDDKEIDGALDATLNNDEVKNESNEDVSEEVVIRMDDDDLDIHGFVKWDIEEKVEFVDDEKDADVFPRSEVDSVISDICDKFHYDPSSFSIQNTNSQVDDNGENWVSLDSMHPGATTLP